MKILVDIFADILPDSESGPLDGDPSPQSRESRFRRSLHERCHEQSTPRTVLIVTFRDMPAKATILQALFRDQ
jgi:hypothetical protein